MCFLRIILIGTDLVYPVNCVNFGIGDVLTAKLKTWPVANFCASLSLVP